MSRAAMRLFALTLVTDIAASPAFSTKTSADEPAVRHIDVYREPGRYGGWPANNGIWCWGDEILVGFNAGFHKNNGPGRHAIDHDKPNRPLLARSLDGGITWKIEDPSDRGAWMPDGGERSWRELQQPIELAHPDFALTVRHVSVEGRPSRFFFSTDRGRSWDGPFRLPLFGQTGIAARTDYVVNGKRDCMLFLTADKQNGAQGRPLCVRTTDGGKSWRFVAWVMDEPKGFAIMPTTVRLAEIELLTAVRRREGPKRWIETHRSTDHGRTWRPDPALHRDAGAGNPPSMIRLRDGRLCVTWGYRAAPFSIRACLSDDNGRTWGETLVLRDDGGGNDLGFPRTVQRTDGRIVTVYYFHDKPDSERYIAATIWDPDAVGGK